MEFLDLSRQRYSVRKFDPRPVEQEKLDLVLEAGRLAPTATNAQPIRVLVVRSDEARAKLAAATAMTYGAPVSLLVCYDVDAVWQNRREPGYNAGEMDGSIVCDEMMLMATELGLGTLWARGYNTDDIVAAMDIPTNLRLVCILDVGYPASDSEPSPKHEDRNPLESMVTYL